MQASLLALFLSATIAAADVDAGQCPANNPLGIAPNPNRSDNFFLILGDWGAPTAWGAAGGCQKKVAQMMNDYVRRQEALGKKLLFVGALGDNFYPIGLDKDDQWFTQWKNVYGSLAGAPWLAVMGNHDHGNGDRLCACGRGCKQFNGPHRPAGTENFWMPNYYWSYFIPGVDLEVIGLDTSAVDIPGLGGDGCSRGAYYTCQACGGQGNVQNFLNGVKAAGEALIDERARAGCAKTSLIMQHYDGSYGIGRAYKQRYENANHGKTKVLSAYGHVHDQVCQGDRSRGCDVILSGGGGGWQGGSYFGFTAVHLTDDGGFQAVMETDEVRIHQNFCNYFGEHAQQNATGKVFV